LTDFSRLEIALKRGLFDANGEGVKNKAFGYFGIEYNSVKSVRVLTFDSGLEDSVKKAFQERVTDPVTEVSSFSPLVQKDDFDYILWVGWHPGVKDNTGEVAIDLLSQISDKKTNIYSSDYYIFRGGNLKKEDIEKIGDKLLANPIVQTFKVYLKEEWDNNNGIGANLQKVRIKHRPTYSSIPASQLTNEDIERISVERETFLNPRDIPTIVNFFKNENIIEKRKEFGLEGPTDVELESICQARSDHCNHNTFNGKFYYTDKKTGKTTIINNLFKECIVEPTKKLAAERPWIKSILWDNAGVAALGNGLCYVVTGETHNSPSNLEGYGGAITGIVGVYRDIMGSGKGAFVVLGAYTFCVGDQDYSGPLDVPLHPKRLLDAVIEGVKDGGNKSGNPTMFGNVQFEPESMGKSLVFVYPLGIIPEEVLGKPSYEKHIDPGNLIIMSGGRVGKDGMHGVTAASASLDETIPAGHVQIGDPYTQKKMQDFLIEARDQGLIKFITDNGGGGLSSSVGESSRFNYDQNATERRDGAEVYLDKVPLKYHGLDPWEIFVSESQERMTIGIEPNNLDRFMELSKKHDVESTVIGKFTNSGALHLRYEGETCAYLPSELLEEQFPQWEFNAEWVEPEERGLYEPKLKLEYHNELFKRLLQQPNIASKEWVSRQYDHEVQGAKVIGPLVGIENDIDSDAIVLRSDLKSDIGIAITQILNPKYSKIDAREMVASAIDEAVRGVLIVGGDINHLTGIDNFCWPSIEKGKPNAEHKAAQLVRANWALKEFCLEYGIPLLSGKDSMYCDGTFLNKETEKKETISGLETMQFSIQSKVNDVNNCITSDAKEAGNLVYLIGTTKNELGGSEFYKMLGETGLNVPKTDAKKNLEIYKKFVEARDKGYCVSTKNIRAGGLGVHLFKMAAGGNLGIEIDLNNVRIDESFDNTDYIEQRILASESTGRIAIEVKEENREEFESVMGEYASCIGKFTKNNFVVKDLNNNPIINEDIYKLKKLWKTTHGNR